MDKKELIYRSSVKVFAREGFDHTKVQMIAEDAQIAVGTIYLYYQSKEEILESIICREYQKRLDFLGGLEDSEEPPIDKIKHFVQYHLDTLIQDREEGKILAQETALTGLSMSDRVKGVITELQHRLYRIIEEAQNQGVVRKTAPQLLFAILLDTVNGFMCSLLLEDNDTKEYPELKLQAVEFILNAIKN
jgi:TetR/AcrR family fatty acid metabolism transcriptional regulator